MTSTPIHSIIQCFDRLYIQGSSTFSTKYGIYYEFIIELFRKLARLNRAMDIAGFPFIDRSVLVVYNILDEISQIHLTSMTIIKG